MPGTGEAWVKLPTWAIVNGVPLVFAVGWFVPMLSVTLLAFLAVDLVLGAMRRTRATRQTTSA